MTKTITRVYSDYAAAELAVRELKAAGLGDSHIGIVASNADGWHKPGGGDVDPKHDKDRDGKDDRAEGAVTGGGMGAIVGGVAGVRGRPWRDSHSRYRSGRGGWLVGRVGLGRARRRCGRRANRSAGGIGHQ